MATCCINLGGVLKHLQRDDDALPVFRRAVAIRGRGGGALLSKQPRLANQQRMVSDLPCNIRREGG